MNLLENMELERDLERGVNDWEGLSMIGAGGSLKDQLGMRWE